MKNNRAALIFKILALYFLVKFGKESNVDDYTIGMLFIWLFFMAKKTKIFYIRRDLYGSYMFSVVFNIAALYFVFHYAFVPVWSYAEFLNSFVIIIFIIHLIGRALLCFNSALKIHHKFNL